MKAKRILTMLLLCTMSLPLIACDVPLINKLPFFNKDTDTAENEQAESPSETDGTNSHDQNDPGSEPTQELITKTYSFSEITDKIKTYGRTSVLDGGLTCDNTATGIEFNAYIKGTLTVEVEIKRGSALKANKSNDALEDDCYFTLYVDGARIDKRFHAPTGMTTPLELATFETGGVHNIRLIRQTEAKNALADLKTVTFTGYFEEAPANAQYFVEFLGASITAGYGNLGQKGDEAAVAQTSVNQDGTQAYFYLAARKLGVDHSLISASGVGVVSGYRPVPIGTMFGAESYYRNNETAYTPTRTPDLVVIGVGSNDEAKGTEAEALNTYKTGVTDLITQVRQTYGKNVPIVWVNYSNKTASPTYHETAQAAIDALGGESAGIYSIRLKFNTNGGNTHPDLVSQADNAETLALFIQEKNILKGSTPVTASTTYQVTDVLDNIKQHGRTFVLGNGLICDFSASGIEFNAYVEGNVKLNVTVTQGDGGLKDDCYFTLYIDGVRSEKRLHAPTGKTTELILGTFDGGVHNVRLISQTEPRNSLVELTTLSFAGYFEKAPEKAPYHIEFLGASILSGYGILTTSDQTAAEAQKSVHQDVTQALTYLTAQNLGADCSIISASGLGLVNGFRPFTMSQLFGAASYYRDADTAYTPTYTPDLVVINLGGNDVSKSVTVDEWNAALPQLINQIRTTYDRNVPIVFIYKKANTFFPDVTQTLVDGLGGTANGLYICKITNNTSGGANHPDVVGHAMSAQDLTKFILDNGLLDGMTAHQVSQNTNNLKLHGRTETTSTGLRCDHVASGIEFNAYIEGALSVSVTVSKGTVDARTDDCYFTLYVDGVRVEQRFKALAGKTTTIHLATFTTGGIHNIRLIKQTEPRNALAEINTLIFKGQFEQAPAAAQYRIEFLGDSNVTGYGNLTSGGDAVTAQTSVNQDATQAFAYLTAQKLGADHSILAASGIGVVNGFRTFPMKDLFENTSHFRNQTVKYTSFTPTDLVVINLGSNDTKASTKTTVEEWNAGVTALIDQVRNVYGKNTPIVFIYRKDNTLYPTVTQELLTSLGGEGNGLYLCQVIHNVDGGNNHPSLSAHAIASQQLAGFIQDHNILK